MPEVGMSEDSNIVSIVNVVQEWDIEISKSGVAYPSDASQFSVLVDDLWHHTNGPGMKSIEVLGIVSCFGPHHRTLARLFRLACSISATYMFGDACFCGFSRNLGRDGMEVSLW